MYDTGATAFMLVCAMLVLLMTPGVAFFYGGLARRKNVVNTMFMSFVIIGILGIVWILRSVRLPVFRKRYARRSAST